MTADITGHWIGHIADNEYLELCIKPWDSKIAGACAIGAKDARPSIGPISGSLDGQSIDLAIAAGPAGSLARTLQGTLDGDTLTAVLDGEPIMLSRTKPQSAGTGAGPQDPSIQWADIQCSQGCTEREINFDNSADTYVVKSGPPFQGRYGPNTTGFGTINYFIIWPSWLAAYGSDNAGMDTVNIEWQVDTGNPAPIQSDYSWVREAAGELTVTGTVAWDESSRSAARSAASATVAT
jgi:hypothetical protein